MRCAVNLIFDCAGVCNTIQLMNKKRTGVTDSLIITVICEEFSMKNA